jgi:galactosamine-6-phosphate isomerase
LKRYKRRIKATSLPLWIGPSHDAISREAARRILAALAAKRDLLLCAAGGSTPARTYELLAEAYAREPKSFRSLRVLKLDEWGDLRMDDPGSCERQLRTQLIGRLALRGRRYFGFRSDAPDPELECKKVRDRLAAEGPIDLCVLGLGINGHIGMNEPASSLQPLTHVAQLSKISMQHPMLSKSRRLPSYGLTLGMSEILASREILLLVSGPKKRRPLEILSTREITTQFPASFLWLHPNWTLLCDRDAAAGAAHHPAVTRLPRLQL